MRKKKHHNKGKNDDDLFYIRNICESNHINHEDIEGLADIDYPLFSFKYLVEVSIDNKSTSSSFYYDFIIRLKKLSELGWDEINKSHRHSFGMEHIPIKQVKPHHRLPEIVTKDVENLDVFRAVGDNQVFVGLRRGRVFFLFFIEAKFGDIYDH